MKHSSLLLAIGMTKPVSELKSDDRNIAVLARAYHGLGIDAVWTKEGGFKK